MFDAGVRRCWGPWAKTGWPPTFTDRHVRSRAGPNAGSARAAVSAADKRVRATVWVRSGATRRADRSGVATAGAAGAAGATGGAGVGAVSAVDTDVIARTREAVTAESSTTG